MSDEEKRGLLQTPKQDRECRDELPEFAVHNAGRMTGTLRRVDLYDEWLDEKYPPIRQDTESPDDGNGERRAGLKPRPLQTADDGDEQPNDQD